ncbi:MAG: hypothetical protein GXO31_07070 [Epsilonproteobacteria bacterium]|nr:hypothetical protein [Campylobacterota bacterium]
MKNKIEEIFKKIKEGSYIEYEETKLLIKLLAKKDKKEEERKFIREQLRDLVRMGFGGAVTALPFGSVIFLAIAKALKKAGDIELLPSGFVEEADLHELVKKDKDKKKDS